jgi:hypothetical protein
MCLTLRNQETTTVYAQKYVPRVTGENATSLSARNNARSGLS